MSSSNAEIEVLKSRTILESVIDRLNLDLHIASTEESFINRLIQEETRKPNISLKQYALKKVLKALISVSLKFLQHIWIKVSC